MSLPASLTRIPHGALPSPHTSNTTSNKSDTSFRKMSHHCTRSDQVLVGVVWRLPCLHRLSLRSWAKFSSTTKHHTAWPKSSTSKTTEAQGKIPLTVYRTLLPAIECEWGSMLNPAQAGDFNINSSLRLALTRSGSACASTVLCEALHPFA